MKKGNKRNQKANGASKQMLAKAVRALEALDEAREKARHAKAEFKKARKAYRIAKKAAKGARKILKDAKPLPKAKAKARKKSPKRVVPIVRPISLEPAPAPALAN